MTTQEIKNKLLSNFTSSHHAIYRMVRREIDKQTILEAIEKGKVRYCQGDILKFILKDVTVVVCQKNVVIITVYRKESNKSRRDKNKLRKKLIKRY